LHFREDYRKAGVPMLPVVSGEKKSVRIIAGTTLMIVLFSILPFFNHFGMIYLVTASISGVIMLALSIWLLLKPSERVSWIVFKVHQPISGHTVHCLHYGLVVPLIKGPFRVRVQPS